MDNLENLIRFAEKIASKTNDKPTELRGWASRLTSFRTIHDKKSLNEKYQADVKTMIVKFYLANRSRFEAPIIVNEEIDDWLNDDTPEAVAEQAPLTPQVEEQAAAAAAAPKRKTIKLKKPITYTPCKGFILYLADTKSVAIALSDIYEVCKEVDDFSMCKFLHLLYSLVAEIIPGTSAEGPGLVGVRKNVTALFDQLNALKPGQGDEEERGSGFDAVGSVLKNTLTGDKGKGLFEKGIKLFKDTVKQLEGKTDIGEILDVVKDTVVQPEAKEVIDGIKNIGNDPSVQSIVGNVRDMAQQGLDKIGVKLD